MVHRVKKIGRLSNGNWAYRVQFGKKWVDIEVDGSVEGVIEHGS
jgi:hypothetical protein